MAKSRNMKTQSIGFTTLAVLAAGLTVWMALPQVSPAAALGTPAFRSTYDKPPQNVLDVLHAPAPAVPVLSPSCDKALLVTWVEYPSITRVAEPFLRLAGNRVEPRNRSNHSTPGGYGIAPCANDYVLLKISDASEIHVALPPGVCAGSPIWSADGKWFAFENTGRASVELWVGDGDSGEVHRVGDLRLNQMLGSTIQWMADQKTLLVKLVPSDQGPPPSEEVVSIGPSIQETGGEKGQSSTYEARDVLKNQHDEDLFDYYAASQLALVDAKTGAVTPIGPVAAYADLNAAPDGEHILVEAIQRPYSHLVTSERFPRDVNVWDRAGKIGYRLAQIPLADRVPIHGVRTGPRDFAWRANMPATLVWAEALDGGDWNVKVPERDKVMIQTAPFTSPPREIVRMEQRFAGFTWGEQTNFALLTDFDENRHWTRTFVANVDDPTAHLRVLWDLSTDEHYKDPGSPVLKPLANGAFVVRQEGDSIYLNAQGSSPDGDRPFLDRFDIQTGKSERLFRCGKDALERFVGFPGGASTNLLTWHQSPTDPPNLFLLTSATAVPNDPSGEAAYAWTSQPLTHIPDPTPPVRAIRKRLVKYKRQDGLDLSFTIYLPPGYQEGTRVPTVLYAYPLDYAGAAQAGQVTGSQQTFTRLYDYRFVLLAGYAIIDRAAFPIVGDPKKAYDTYLEQLVADAKAAVDKAIEIGVADPDRIGATGHSHGALMTVNLLAHSDLFRAGVATSGSYNKTLTAFGFQNERRSVWEAPDVYFKVSPFFSADKLKLPLLIMHGEDDANPGTTPIQAEKLYEAIRGNGGIARLVMLPHEPHWYSAMESNEQELYEMIRWFDRYVKNAPPRGLTKETKTN
jgi:dipeptidyl aminopeptidase/acylaminoacyl peptidase